MTTQSTTVRPAVWIGCLACYNEGVLNGEWFAAEDAEKVTLLTLHRNPTDHEEIWAFDIEGFPRGTSEMSAHTAALWGELFHEVGETLWEPLLAWVENGSYVEDSNGLPDFSSFEDRYRGCWPSFADYLADEIEALQQGWPEEAIRYFDEKAYERDAQFDYDILDAPGGEIFIFASF
ncbi:antirestriction protein ArdA [Trueperella pyogenes]|uniref:antirestriction protein ArdA n=1 Tax=Trueperella pyogenes TaxID=1661 RepID=UPI0006B23F07|nr:antirestriction protein ArdA [Trueperella pyogenes]ALD74009.1 antirestriction protein [Trueperella pyogenes]